MKKIIIETILWGLFIGGGLVVTEYIVLDRIGKQLERELQQVPAVDITIPQLEIQETIHIQQI